MMVKFYYPDGDWCYRAIQTVHAIFTIPKANLLRGPKKGTAMGIMNSKLPNSKRSARVSVTNSDHT